MTTILIFSLIAIVLYMILAGFLGKRLFSGPLSTTEAKDPTRKWLLSLGSTGLIIHAIVLVNNIIILPKVGLNMGFFNATSLITWLIVLLLIVTSVTKPVANLGIAIFPLASLAILLDLIFPSNHIILVNQASELRFHILISILAYSLFSIAAIHAVLLAIQNKFLRNKQPGGFIRALPPLETMETLLFQMIGMGFILQSLSLITGFIYLEDMFQQHLVHKTVFSIIAWLIFAILLWGRWKFGWRGRTAIRWTFIGFTVMLLGYLGSKLVMELVLNR